MAWTFCTSGSAILDAGVNANAACETGAAFDNWSDYVEGEICAECNTDFLTGYSSLSTGIKNALGEIASAKVAMKIINYDLNAYTSREAETMLDVLDDRASKTIQILKDKSKQKLGVVP